MIVGKSTLEEWIYKISIHCSIEPNMHFIPFYSSLFEVFDKTKYVKCGQNCNAKKCQMRQLLAYRLTNEYSDTNLKDLQQIHFTSMILEK